MIVMTVIMKMKMILLHLDNHQKYVRNIITIIYKILNNFFVFGKYKRLLSPLKMHNKTHQIVHLTA